MDKKSRQRGVRASRAKLEQALRQSGFKTQAALAEKIAKLEGLESTPKDLVSKAFREKLIEPQSLERIAVALDVKAYTLYQSSDVQTRLPTLSANNKPNPTATFPWHIATAILLIATITTVFWLSLVNSSNAVKLTLPGMKPSFLIYPQKKSLYSIAEQLKSILDKHYQVTLIPVALNEFNNSPSDLIKEFQSDWVLSIDAIQIGRYSGVRLYLSDGSFDYPVLVENASQEEQFTTLFDDPIVKAQLQQDIQTSIDTLAPVSDKGLLSKEQQSTYLISRQLLEDYQSFENLNKAQLLMEALLREQPLFGPAFALLCEIGIHESWRENEKASLRQANVLCQQALSLAPNNLYVQTVAAFLQEKNGNKDRALKQYQSILMQSPNHIESLMGLASVNFAIYRSEGNQDALNQALGFARQAALVQEDYWRPFQLLALIEFSSGNRDNAIQAWEAQVSIRPNELILSNLGLMYLCNANFELAKTRLDNAQTLAPDSYMPLEGLASIHYYQSNYQQALNLRLKVQELIGNEDAGIHQQWGDLADTYLQLGQSDSAKQAYRTALTILERDQLRGNGSQDDQVYRLYYQVQLFDDIEEKQILIKQTSATESAELSSPALVRKALILKMIGESEQAQFELKQAAKVCPAYLQRPEFDV